MIKVVVHICCSMFLCMNVLLQDGHTALTGACDGGSAEVVQILIKAGANTNYRMKVRSLTTTCISH